MHAAPPAKQREKTFGKIRLQKIAPAQSPVPPQSSMGVGRGKQCQHCRTTNAQAARFCMQCGRSLQMHHPPSPQTTPNNTKPSKQGSGKVVSSSKAWYEGSLSLLLRALVFLGLIAVIGNITQGNFSFRSLSATSATQEPLDIPPTILTPQPFQWTTTSTFSGTGSQQTGSFTSYNDWHIAWTCDPTSFDEQAYFLMIEVDYPDGTVADSGVDVMCTKDHAHDVYVVHFIGTFSLHIMSIGDWTVEVQEWKPAPS